MSTHILAITLFLSATFFTIGEEISWDKNEIEYYDQFIELRDQGQFSAAATIATEWRTHAKKSSLKESYYSLVQDAEHIDFHEDVLGNVWRDLEVKGDADINQLVKAVVNWVQYMKESYGPKDARTIAGYIKLADIFKRADIDSAIEILKTAEKDVAKARAENENSVPAYLHISILDRLTTLLQVKDNDEGALKYLEKKEKLKQVSGFRDPNRNSGGNYNKIEVFFGTDRKPTGKKSLNEKFGGERISQISYGSTTVSVPLSHTPGVIERPKWWRLEFREDPTKHVSIVKLQTFSKERFFTSLSESKINTQSNRAFVFVHGYNVSFAGAARRTAQIAHDLRFDGLPIFFSWASKASVKGYFTDETTIQLSQKLLEEFLVDIANRTDIEEVYLVGHSMGTRAVSKALPSVCKRLGNRRNIFKEIILAAPDIDREIFFTQISPELGKTGVPITVYTSTNDKALKVSKSFRSDRPRVGEDAFALTGRPHLESIDASVIQADFMAHSYFSDDKRLILDIHQLIRERRRAAHRTSTLRTVRTGSGIHWEVRQ